MFLNIPCHNRQPPSVIVIAATFSIPYQTILYNINCLIKWSENSRRCFLKYLSSHNCVRVMCYVMYMTLPFYRPIHCHVKNELWFHNQIVNCAVNWKQGKGLTLGWSSVVFEAQARVRQGKARYGHYKALKLKPLPRAYTKVGCHPPTTHQVRQVEVRGGVYGHYGSP